MDFQAIEGKPVRIPPGRVEIRLDSGHRRLYRALYASYRTIIDGLPVLREDRDFDGRPVKVTPAQLAALNAAFAAAAKSKPGGSGAFGPQEAGRTSLFKRLQYLS